MPAMAETPSPATGMSGGGKEVCVPLASLSVSDESGTTAPEIGDAVSGNIEGTVTRIEGEEVYFTPTKFNGEDVVQETAETPQESDKQALERAYNEGGQS